MSCMSDVAKGVMDRLATGLAANAFSLAFDVQWGFNKRIWLEVLADAARPRCDVVPMRERFRPTSRASGAYEIGVDICLRTRLTAPIVDNEGTIDPDDFDEPLDVLEEINEYLSHSERRRLASTYQSAVWTESDVAFPWIPSEHIELRQYTGILRATYRVDIDQ